jgi:hypothetical protein
MIRLYSVPRVLVVRERYLLLETRRGGKRRKEGARKAGRKERT